MKSAITALRRQGAKRIIAAVPVAPESEVAALREIADDVVCLSAPRFFAGSAVPIKTFTNSAMRKPSAIFAVSGPWQPRSMASPCCGAG